MKIGKCAYCRGPLPYGQRSGYCGEICQIKANCSNAEDPESCWEWLGALRKTGYGIMRVWLGDRYSMRSPPRVMYAATYGEVPYTQSVLQTCGQKNCCNPAHLKLEVQELQLVLPASRRRKRTPTYAAKTKEAGLAAEAEA